MHYKPHFFKDRASTVISDSFSKSGKRDLWANNRSTDTALRRRVCIMPAYSLPELLPMSRYPHKNLPLKKAKFGNQAFDSQKTPRLGSNRAPLALTVNSEERRKEVDEICNERGWVCDINLSPDNEEDISQLTFLLDKQVVATTTRLAGRNDPCPCGSKKKYKQCCAALESRTGE